MWRSKYISVLILVVGAMVLLTGCSSTGGNADSNGGSGGDSSGSAQASSQADTEKTSASPEPTRDKKPPGGSDASSGKTSEGGAKLGTGGAKAGKKGFPKTAAGSTARASAFEGLEKADVVAKDWNKDAELYSIASVSPEVDAEGRAPGWLYSYVSSSGKGVALISVEKGKARLVQEPPVPESQLQNILEDTLPSSDKLTDSSEAIDRAAKIKKEIQQNPDAQVSAGLDSASKKGPAWTLASIGESGPVQEQVPATP